MFLQILIIMILLLCALQINIHTHKIVAVIGCIDIGGLSWISLKSVQDDISRANLNSIQHAHI
jgi:hypothetical protein